jgi:hypothetical protein
MKLENNTAEWVCLKEAAENRDNVAPAVFLTGMVTVLSVFCTTLRKGFNIRHGKK